MKKKMSLEDELDVTRTSVAELTGWCITIALHELFGIGRERLNRVNNRQRMLAEQSMAVMMQPNERGMPSTEKARRMRAEALPESVPREFRVPALRAARNRREQQLKIVGDRAATMAWQLHARACMEVLGFGPDRLNRLYDEMRHNYDQMNTWGKEDGIDVAMERMRKCACDALKTDDIVVEDVEDSKELAAQRQQIAADAFAAARTQLAAFAAGKDYAAWLVKSAAALAETMGESGTLYARTADLPLLQGKLPAGVALAADDTITLGGLRAANPTTGLAADDTLEARLDAQHDWFLQNAGLEITI